MVKVICFADKTASYDRECTVQCFWKSFKDRKWFVVVLSGVGRRSFCTAPFNTMSSDLNI